MGKTKRKWIRLDFSDPDALRAEDIPYDSSNSIKDKLDESGGNFVELSGTQTVSGEKTFVDTLTINGVHHFGALSSDPTPISGGDKYFNTIDNAEKIWNGSDWIEQPNIPIFTDLGSLEYAKNTAYKFCDEAKKSIDLLSDTDAKKILIDLAEYSINREK